VKFYILIEEMIKLLILFGNIDMRLGNCSAVSVIYDDLLIDFNDSKGFNSLCYTNIPVGGDLAYDSTCIAITKLQFRTLNKHFSDFFKNNYN
jgi:hypothetical protein